MRQLAILAAIFVCALCWKTPVQAASDDDPICFGYRQNFAKIGTDNIAALAKAEAQIPTDCPALKADARAALAGARQRAAEQAQAQQERVAEEARLAREREDVATQLRALADKKDDDAYEAARRTNTRDAYDSYISTYPNGRHLADARSARASFQIPAPPPPPSATPVISVKACNKTKVTLMVAESYMPVGETEGRWRYHGWYEVQAGSCLDAFDTTNAYFYFYAEEKGNNSHSWGGNTVEGRKSTSNCVVHPDAFDFYLNGDEKSCPSYATSVPFFTLYYMSDHNDTFTFNFN